MEVLAVAAVQAIETVKFTQEALAFSLLKQEIVELMGTETTVDLDIRMLPGMGLVVAAVVPDSLAQTVEPFLAPVMAAMD
jgi:hypothetical protein